MSKTDGDKAGEARRRAFGEWMEDEGDPGINRLGLEVFGQRELVDHLLWRAFMAGERHGRAQLDAILSHGRREA